MKYSTYVFFILTIVTSNLVAQHLPLQIGNEWHYIQGLGINKPYIANAVDSLYINNKTYFKIERWDISTQNIVLVTYGRLEGDSLYYRIIGNGEKLIFNFNWKDSHVEFYPEYSDSICLIFELIKRDTITVWGISTYIYAVHGGSICTGQDTSWSLSGSRYLKYFGSMDAFDGALIGAKINGITYGNLHPVPVELISFSNQIVSSSILLQWATVTETNNYGFEIIRNFFSDSNSTFKIGFINGNGTTTERNDYEFWDKDLRQGDYEYQLIQIDYDGTRTQVAETVASITNPNSYSLHQNYPNPFNPVTKINFSIPQRSKVELIIYNTLGQRIATVVNEQKEAGNYTVAFNGINLPSGVYFYRISAGEFSQTKKLILLK